MTFFWILWGFNAVMSLIPIYFFFVGLTDGTVTSRNMGLWGLVLLAIAVVLGGSLWLKAQGQFPIAKILLIVAAVPGILVILYFLVVITSKTKWN
jgi:hypothetical protein